MEQQTIIIGLGLFGALCFVLFLTMINSFRIASKIDKLITMCRNENNMGDIREDLKKIEEIRKKIESRGNY